ncbi:MAG: quinone-dependent dihydroorotate dehydrogenase [Halothiobacillaceae bacterium]
MSYALAKALLFRMDPERAHDVALAALDLAAATPWAAWQRRRVPDDPVEVMGLRFPNRVGLAAGLDKNAAHINALGRLGFGFVEVGTVTPRPQPGNPKPRLFRLPEAEAIINRMGFNNLGLERFLENVRKRDYPGILGLNIGKNFDTPVENALDDYRKGLEAVHPWADYVTVNISSPNTQGLRALQHGELLDALLGGLKDSLGRLESGSGRRVPLVLKVAPDLGPADMDAISAALLRFEIDGLIATNTTLDRTGVEGLEHAEQAGGLSGAPLMGPATEVVRAFAARLEGRLPIIAAGGICRGADARAKIEAGASLVQIYTGFIYRGPPLVAEIAQALSERSA